VDQVGRKADCWRLLVAVGGPEGTFLGVGVGETTAAGKRERDRNRRPWNDWLIWRRGIGVQPDREAEPAVNFGSGANAAGQFGRRSSARVGDQGRGWQRIRRVWSANESRVSKRDRLLKGGLAVNRVMLAAGSADED